MAPPSHGLPDEIVIWEILVRLPPKALLHCHAVCRAWRRDASTHKFLLAHHDRQPSLHLLTRSACKIDIGESLHIIPYDHHQAGAADKLRPVAGFGSKDGLMLMASCDGILVMCTYDIQFFICNPVTRQCARLPTLYQKMFLGMYRHRPTGEYRILFSGSQYACYVFALGSDQPPRHVAWPPPPERDLVCFNGDALLFRGSLHWHPVIRGGANMIVAFDTIAERFRLLIHAPVTPARAQLFEMDGVLGMSSFNDAASAVDIWMMHEYERHVWTFKCRVKLPVADIKVRSGKVNPWNVIIVPGDGVLPMLVQFDKWLLQVDSDGRLLAGFLREHLFLTQYRLKQTLVPHSFFPKLDGYALNASPFM